MSHLGNRTPSNRRPGAPFGRLVHPEEMQRMILEEWENLWKEGRPILEVSGARWDDKLWRLRREAKFTGISDNTLESIIRGLSDGDLKE